MNEIYLIEKNAEGYYELYFYNSPALAYFIQKIPSARFIMRDRCWRVNLHDRLFVREFCDYAVRRRLASSVCKVGDRAEVQGYPDKMPDLQYPITHLKLQPYDYQRKGIQYMVDHKRCFNGDDMGLGKTFQSIAAVSIARAYPCLVVAPATMKVTWQREFQRFIGKQAMILSNENKDTWHRHMETGTCNIFITNYESVKKYFVSRVRGRTTVKNIVLDKRAAMFKSVIIDESHRCCNDTALWSIYLEAICANKEYVWLLTGTPRITSNIDLIQQLQIMRRLDDFGGAARFKERYCQGPDKSSNLYELHYRLWEICYFRRDKAIALKDLPEKTRQYLTVDIDNRKEYEFAENDLIRYLVEYESASDATLKSAAKATAMVQINHLRQISARGKMKEAKQFIHDVIDGGDKLIVFAFHKSVMTEIMATFPGSVSVTGSDSQEKKQAAIDKFQNDPDCKLIALNYKSGGVGITLTAASRILFIEFPWTASDCEQAECRAHRNGQKNAVNCYYLLARNTIDERILEIIQKEREDSSVVTGAINNIEESIVDATLRHFKSKHKI
ncbi:MAG: DEAD/DEAH box helicase [Muribaculaceae bacterium]|nr:DEAD/DEAH box helicase [Muribaculaceae bacterium]